MILINHAGGDRPIKTHKPIRYGSLQNLILKNSVKISHL